MDSKNTSKPKYIGVVGVGSFGAAIANILAAKNPVMVYARKQEVVDQINETHTAQGKELNKNIIASNDPEQLSKSCDVLFFMVPSSGFQNVVRTFSPFLFPYHLIIHGTKGLCLNLKAGEALETVKQIRKSQILTMSEVILQETVVVRVGCLA